MTRIIAVTAFVLTLLAIMIVGLAHGASSLELWCIDQGQNWEPTLKQCTIAPGATANVPSSLTVLDDERLVISGTLTISGVLSTWGHSIIDNFGVLSNGGHVYHGHKNSHDYGTLNNAGVFDNRGTFENNYYGKINNSGAISNSGSLANNGSSVITNEGTFDNGGVIENYSHLHSHEQSVITNTGVISNHGYLQSHDRSTIHNEGTIDNESSFASWEASAIVNYGTFRNDGSDDVYNGGYQSTPGPRSTFLNYGEVILRRGRFINAGIFTNTVSGTLDTYLNMISNELFVNHGVVTIHSGRLYNYQDTYPEDSTGEFYNYGTIHNHDELSNTYFMENNGEIFNWGKIANMDYYNPAAYFDNNGTITNYCSGYFEGRPIHNEDGVIIEYRALSGRCNFLPMLAGPG